MAGNATWLRAAACVVAIAATASVAAADTNGSAADFDVVLPPPPTYHATGVKVDEHLGAKLPLDAAFRTSDGAFVTLGQLVGGDLPTILTFNYSDCPQLCSLQLNGLTAALPTVVDGDPPMRLGRQFRIVTIDLEPNEPLDKLAAMKARYVARLQQLGATGDLVAGWTFLAAAVPGSDASIRRVAEAVGFHYAYVPERAEWAHPAALIFTSSAGTVTRYVYGIEYPAAMMRESIFKAGVAEPSTTVGFMLRCYHYDPDANSYAHAGVIALRIAAGGAIVLLLAVFAVVHFVRRHSRGNGAMS